MHIETGRVDADADEKSRVSLRIRASLKNRAQRLGVNLSGVLERSLEDELSRREQEAWVQANREAIAAYNQRMEAYGPTLSEYRSF